jgi:hypothetical protein
MAAVWNGDADDHPYGGCFTGTIWAEESEHASAANLKTQIINGGEIAKFFCNALYPKAYVLRFLHSEK